MVALEPGEPLLLYIMATTDVMSMVLVVERPDPKAEEAPDSQNPEVHPAPKLSNGTDTIIECHPVEANPGADNQELTGSQLPRTILDSGS
jgi:hypothetical protein